MNTARRLTTVALTSLTVVAITAGAQAGTRTNKESSAESLTVEVSGTASVDATITVTKKPRPSGKPSLTANPYGPTPWCQLKWVREYANGAPSHPGGQPLDGSDEDCDDLPGHDKPDTGETVELQMLSINDYHGHIEATDKPLGDTLDPSGTEVGGAEYLASKLKSLREGHDNTVTVAAGDLIGGSTFLSGLFHDEPSIETLNEMGMDIAGVGNHEFDEGTDELQRIIDGGCHPIDGCYFDDQPYAGTKFPYLAANVIRKDTGKALLPPVAVREYEGVKVGFIGMTLEETPTLVNPAGVSSVEFKDEVESANKWAGFLTDQGVDSIVVLLHEGGFQSGNYNECADASGPIVDIAKNFAPSIDAVVTGHTHQPYICDIKDPEGNSRLVTSASSYGRVVTETTLVLDKDTGDVVRDETTAQNHLVDRTTADPAQTAILDKWKTIADPLAGAVVGTIAEDVSGDASGDRGGETPMVDLIADAILFGTKAPEDGGSQIAFMNVGGVRASFLKDTITNGEAAGEITYAEAYATSPFGNLLVSMDLTGAQIKELLEQQFVSERGRQLLALGVSEGFTYTWDADAPEGSKVDADSMMLNGGAIDPSATYRVSTLNFLAEGGDGFTVFSEGQNVLGGPEDLANLVAYLKANPGITPPADRVAGL